MSAQQAKSGALQMLHRLLDRLEMRIVPYLNLVVVPLMGLTSDSAPAVRGAATSAFASAVALLPLAQVERKPTDGSHKHSVTISRCALHPTMALPYVFRTICRLHRLRRWNGLCCSIDIQIRV